MKTMTGCVHNLKRKIVFNDSAAKLNGNDFFRIVCPYGCEDIIVNVVRDRRNMIKNINKKLFTEHLLKNSACTTEDVIYPKAG